MNIKAEIDAVNKFTVCDLGDNASFANWYDDIMKDLEGKEDEEDEGVDLNLLEEDELVEA